MICSNLVIEVNKNEPLEEHLIELMFNNTFNIILINYTFTTGWMENETFLIFSKREMRSRPSINFRELIHTPLPSDNNWSIRE